MLNSFSTWIVSTKQAFVEGFEILLNVELVQYAGEILHFGLFINHVNFVAVLYTDCSSLVYLIVKYSLHPKL